MGGGSSRRKKTNTSIPTSTPAGNATLNRSRSAHSSTTGNRNAEPINPYQQTDPVEAYQTIANLQNQHNTMQHGASGSYGTPPYAPSSFDGSNLYSYQQQPMVDSGGRYGDTDFVPLADINGLTATGVAFLYQEFMIWTHGGTTKIDLTVFRKIFEGILMESNEHAVGIIENMFNTFDRNHDGFLDFPEFVDAFKNVLTGQKDIFLDQLNTNTM